MGESPGEYALKNVNGLGFTERITLSSPGLVEVRCRRRNEQGSNNARDSMYWQALRGRLLTRPSSYPGVSLMAVTVETGGKLAAQSDRRVNVVATRAYDSGTARTISGRCCMLGTRWGWRWMPTPSTRWSLRTGRHGRVFRFRYRRQYLSAGNAAEDSQCRQVPLPVK
nr:Uncharacterised protein [Klebsiella pneumoniae]